jgi:ABC-type multidrug transport system fused ATPase/permease subunit
LAGAERVFEVIDEPKASDSPAARDIPQICGKVALENIAFSYIPGKQILNGRLQLAIVKVGVKTILRNQACMGPASVLFAP